MICILCQCVGTLVADRLIDRLMHVFVFTPIILIFVYLLMIFPKIHVLNLHKLPDHCPQMSHSMLSINPPLESVQEGTEKCEEEFLIADPKVRSPCTKTHTNIISN